MGPLNKQKKRTASETVANPKPAEGGPLIKKQKLGNKKLEKKAVIKATNGDAKKIQVQTTAAETKVPTARQKKKQASINRKLAARGTNKAEGQVPKPLKKEEEDKKAAKNADGNSASDKKAAEPTGKVDKKLKAKLDKKAEKNKLRKEKRLQNGQYKTDQIQMTAEKIKERIEEIKGRGELTKTARRRLALLKKKLEIQEGTAVSKNEEAKGPVGNNQGKGLSQSEKRRVRRGKQGEKGDAQEVANDKSDPDVEKPVDIQTFKKKNVVVNKGQNKTVAAKGPVGKPGVKKIVEIKTAEPDTDDDNEDDEDEDKDENEDEDDVEVAVSGEAEAESSAEDEEEENDDEDEENDDEEEENDDEDEENDDEEEENDEEEKEDEDDSDADETMEESAKPKVPIALAKRPKAQQKAKVDKPKKQLETQEENTDKKKRYVLFVGNLPFDAGTDEIKEHFQTKVGKVTSVRIPRHPGSQTKRGFAYVEFTNKEDYEKGLSLHNTLLQGRLLNVEYTLSGSKQVSNRKELISKNQKLHAMRKAGKLAGSQKHDQKRSVRRFKKKEQERGTK